MLFDLGQEYNSEFTPEHTYRFSHNEFRLMYQYKDGFLNNYESDIFICRQIIYHLLTNIQEKQWNFSFQDDIIGDIRTHGLICRRDNELIRFGIAGEDIYHCCYLEFEFDNEEIKQKVVNFYETILNDLIDLKVNSLSYTIKKMFR